MQFSSEYQPMFLSLFIKNYILMGFINYTIFLTIFIYLFVIFIPLFCFLNLNLNIMFSLSVYYIYIYAKNLKSFVKSI